MMEHNVDALVVKLLPSFSQMQSHDASTQTLKIVIQVD